MRVSSEFSKYASKYDSYNSIQNIVVKKLLSLIKSEPKNILDLGCGSGAISKNITWKYEHLMGVDFASGMLDVHPKSEKIECLYGNFNNIELFDTLLDYKFDCVISSSSLQWANDLDVVFRNLKGLNVPIYLAIFTSNTFKTLNKTASLTSLLDSPEKIDNLQKKYFNVNFEVIKYKLEFNSTREMFKYIKKSGVSGSRRILSYKQTKQLMENYPLNYLEFEVAFITSH